MPSEFGIDCGSPCESVTISYLNANQYLTTRLALLTGIIVIDQDPA